MRIVVQRVSGAKVQVDSKITGQIEKGLLVYLSVTHNDTETDAKFIADKIINLRIFGDDNGKMNLSLADIAGKVLLISNFTLHGDCRKGRRPSFDAAANPDHANQLYEKVIELIKEQGVNVQTGIFAANMQVTSTNDGPVTFILDTEKNP